MSQLSEINPENKEREEIEIDLLDLFYFYRSKIVWIIAAFLIGALLSGLVTQVAIAPKYTATSTMYMVSSSSGSVVDLSDLNIGESISSDYVELIKTRPIIEGVIKDQNLDYTYEQMLNMLNLTVVANTRIIKIAVTSEDRVEAKNIANELAHKAEAQLPKLMDAADEIVIARGDLGNAMPLWKLPAIQKRISACCRAAGKPFMVVTQMLSSMEQKPVPTRAEVSDIFNAVLDGASSVMVTGETAVGKYPRETIRYLVNTAAEAERFLRM